jgi:hypothetical protein
MMLSPQAPPPAYIAVFFQGLLGELLFWNRKYFHFFCILLAMVAMVELAFQRILSLTILYGNDFWTALDDFIRKLTGSTRSTSYSYFIAFWYVMFHMIAGILVGLWAGVLPQRILHMKNFQQQYNVEMATGELSMPQRKKKKRMRIILLIVWIVLLGLYIQSFFAIGTPLLPSSVVLRILIRSIIIVFTWYFLISPVLKQILHKWLLRKKQQSAEQVQQVLNLLPTTQGLISRSWQLSSCIKGIRRIFFCCKIILANTFYTTDA